MEAVNSSSVSKKELLSDLLKSKLKDSVYYLLQLGIIVKSVSDDFKSLDQDLIDRDIIARFLVNHISKKISQEQWQQFLTEFHGTVKDSIYAHQVPILTPLLWECSHKWEEIGFLLGLPESVRAECGNSNNNGMKLGKILHAWITPARTYEDQVKPATIQALAEVLGNPFVSMSNVGKHLQSRFTEHCEKHKVHVRKSQFKLPSAADDKTVVHDGKSTLLGIPGEYEENMAYQWMKDGKPLSNDINFNGVTENVLLIRSCQGLEGKYMCYNPTSKQFTFEGLIEIRYNSEKQKLLNKYTVLQAVPNSWPPVGTLTYIKLALVHSSYQRSGDYDYSVRGDMDDILKTKKKIEYCELFGYHRAGVVLVEGRPGCGKTTLTHKISRDWARGPNILKGAKYVFLIPLRLLSTIDGNSLPAILNILFCNNKISKVVADLLEECDGHRACFIIDGLDEYSERNDVTNIIYKLLNKQYLPLAMVIVASRPAGTAKVRHLAEQRVEVLGFSKNQILKYLREYNFKTGSSGASNVETYLKQHVNVYHMCYLPVHTAMICYIYDHYGDVPNTETEIYKLFTLLTIQRKLDQDGDQSKVRQLGKLEGNIKDSFNNVCKLAFDKTVLCKQAVYRSETENRISEVKNSENHSLGLVTIDSTAELLGYVDLYAFLHLTFQEFLAAYHLTTMSREEQLHILTNQQIESISVVWKFFCGLMDFSDGHYNLLCEIMSIKSGNNLFKFRCALESQQKLVCDASFQFSKGGDCDTIAIKDHIFLSIDFNAIGFAIANSNFLVTHLAFKNCFFDLEGIKILIDQIGPLKLNCIKKISFTTRHGEEQFKNLKHLLSKLNSLSCINLTGKHLSSHCIEALTDGITIPTLKVLEISMPLDRSSNQNLKVLSFNSEVLEQVCYDYIDTDWESHKEAFKKLLANFNCKIAPLSDPPHTIFNNLKIDLTRVPTFLNVSTLLLVNCNLKDGDLVVLKNVGANNIETLRLDFNKISCLGAKIISEIMLQCGRLHHLSVSCNAIGNVGAIALSKVLPKMKTLLELDLQYNEIGYEGAVAIGDAVSKFPSYFRLLIWNTKITPEEARKVSKFHPDPLVEKQLEVCAVRYIDANCLEALARAVNCCTNCPTLDFAIKNGTYNGLELFSKRSKYCINLKSIHIPGSCLKYSLLDQLGVILPKCSNLKSVNFRNDTIKCNDISHILKLLKDCSNLQEVDLSGNLIKYDKLVAHNLVQCSVRSLDLSNTNITKYHAASFAVNLRLMGSGLSTFSDRDFFSGNEIFSKFLLTRFNLEGFESHILSNSRQISWCTHLEVLNLAQNEIQCEGAAALAYGLKYCTQLHTLDLSGNKISIDGAKVLAHGLMMCQALQKLVLDKNPLKAEGAANLFSGLKSCTNLQVLSCEKIHLCRKKRELTNDYAGEPGLEGIAALVSAMKCWNHFKELNVKKNTINCKGAVLLGKALKKVSTLDKLDIGGNKIAAAGMFALAESVKRLPLAYLDISGNIINESEAAVSVIALLKNCKRIASFNISLCDIGPDGAATLNNGLKNCTLLLEVSLDNCNIGAEGVIFLMTGLKNCVKLQILSLCNNNISSEGATELTSGLKCLSDLNKLTLSKNDIGVEGCRALKEWLLFNPKHNEKRDVAGLQNFKELELAACNTGPNGAIEIAEGLKHCVNFESLDLQSNCIGSAGAVELAKILKLCYRLLCVQLDDNGIGSQDAIEMANQLKHCTNLQRLSIDSNENLSKITDILSPCKIFQSYC